MQIKFKQWNCSIFRGKYGNGQIALKLNDSRSNEPIANATVAIDESLKPDEVAIKDYAENVGMLDALVNGGCVHPPHREIILKYTTHIITIPICRLAL